ncbi:MAG: RluA family pseudouridine synthase, partial [Lachnospiraceae bacterium]|nr:RluA family pseudouridine synthase [Lachnospiraceae bacterium]
KYGSSKINKEFYDTGVRNQLLHAYKLVFPKNSEERFSDLSERTLTCELPTLFERLMTNRPNGRNEVLT